MDGLKEKMIEQTSKEKFEINFSAEHINVSLFQTADGTFCCICEKPVKLMDYGQAAECFKTDVGDIFEFAESKQLHRLHNKRGATMICAGSLFTLFESRQTRCLTSGFLPSNLAAFGTEADI